MLMEPCPLPDGLKPRHLRSTSLGPPSAQAQASGKPASPKLGMDAHQTGQPLVVVNSPGRYGSECFSHFLLVNGRAPVRRCMAYGLSVRFQGIGR